MLYVPFLLFVFTLLLGSRRLDGGSPLGGVLLQEGAEFIDVNKSFGRVGLGSRQAAAQSVPELHGHQELRRRL